MTLERHTGLSSKTPLRPGPDYTGLRRTGFPITGSQTPATRPRDTGFPPAVKLAIRTRAGNGDPGNARCEATGVWLGRHGGEIQHRYARHMGGSSRPDLNWACNGVLLSREAHRLAESRSLEMHAKGYWLRNGEDPAEVPIMLFSEGGSGITVWLLADGTYGFEPPGGSAA